jgi:hypothetical protein
MFVLLKVIAPKQSDFFRSRSGYLSNWLLEPPSPQPNECTAVVFSCQGCLEWRLKQGTSGRSGGDLFRQAEGTGGVEFYRKRRLSGFACKHFIFNHRHLNGLKAVMSPPDASFP